jgi:hypothetical protein
LDARVAVIFDLPIQRRFSGQIQTLEIDRPLR